jgi:hypothetical protein
MRNLDGETSAFAEEVAYLHGFVQTKERDL